MTVRLARPFASHQRHPQPAQRVRQLVKAEDADHRRHGRLDGYQHRRHAVFHGGKAGGIEQEGENGCHQRGQQQKAQLVQSLPRKRKNLWHIRQKGPAQPGEEEDIGSHRQRVIALLQGKAAENTVKRIAYAGTKAQKQHGQRHPAPAGGQPGGQRTAAHRQQQAKYLSPGEPLPKQQDGKQRYEQRRGIKQDHRRRQGRKLNGAEITIIEEHYAEQSAPGKAPEVPQPDPQQIPPKQQQRQQQDAAGNRRAALHDLHGAKAQGVEPPHKDPDAAPEAARKDHKHWRKLFVHSFLTFPGKSIPPLL